MARAKGTIIFVAPAEGNGGIQSWAKQYLCSLKKEGIPFFHINVSTRRSLHPHSSLFRRVSDGFIDLIAVYRETRQTIKFHPECCIMHTTTSGGLGTLRDYYLVTLCNKHAVKTILHCHYGCIKDDYSKHGFLGRLLRRTLNKYDMIWVLDRESELALNKDNRLKGKVWLTPNPININYPFDSRPKEYNRVAFIGNLIPSKGIYYLTEAASRMDFRLDIIGPGSAKVVSKITKIAGDKLNNTIFLLGRLSNEDALEQMRQTDILALPTYYKSEAFPISILEAMSLSKLVISCPRAAIPDMLTSDENTRCGILIPARSTQTIIDAVQWCQEHKTEADEICRNAYNKVSNSYGREVVERLYFSLYEILESRQVANR